METEIINNYNYLYQCKPSYFKLVDNAQVFGLGDSVRASGYPMDAEIKYDALTAKDWDRADRLGATKSGAGHDNFLSGIIVQFDLNATVKMWTEFERYHFAQIVSSQSTMHRLSKFDLDEQFYPYVDYDIITIMKKLQKRYNEAPCRENLLNLLYSCPVGVKLTARVTTNYRQLKTMYEQRKNHTLPEWREFCEWMVDNLPDFKVMCLGEKD